MQTETPVVAPESPVKRGIDVSSAAAEAAANVSLNSIGVVARPADGDSEEHRQKRVKTLSDVAMPSKREKIHGVAMIKEE